MMQKTIFQLLLLALPLGLAAQDCAVMYDYFKEGATLEYTNYDKKGKVQSVNTQTITAIEENADTLIATFSMSTVDKKGQEGYSTTFPMKCHAGSIYMDMRSIVPPQQMGDQKADLQIEVASTDLMFPPELKAGQRLPDSDMEITMRIGGLQIMNTKYAIRNRKVETEETVTTSAGTYTCMKISYDFEYKLIGTRTDHIEYWYSQAVGMVKSINYDKKGNEKGRMELTKFEK